MSNLTLLTITVLISFALGLSAGQTFQADFWESFAPGELLRLLERAASTMPITHNDVAQRRSDATTSVTELPVTLNEKDAATSKSVRKRSESSNLKTTKVEDQWSAPSSDELKYDQAYEAFVRKYFSDKLAEDDDDSSEFNADVDTDKQDDEHNESDEQQFDTDTEQNSSGGTEPLTEETKTRAQKKTKEKCRRVRKNKQNCVICENAKNGEKSETCSFSRQSEPESYAFETEKSYKKQRDVEEPTSQSVEQTSSEEAEGTDADKSFEVFNKRNIARRRTLDKTPKDSSTCIQMVRRGKICYQCVDGDGPTTKCYMPKKMNSGRVNKTHPAKAKEHKVQKTQQRIYKRTISYSFEKGTNGTAANETPLDADMKVDATTAAVASSGSPHLKEKIIIKVVKQNETIAE